MEINSKCIITYSVIFSTIAYTSAIESHTSLKPAENVCACARLRPRSASRFYRCGCGCGCGCGVSRPGVRNEPACGDGCRRLAPPRRRAGSSISSISNLCAPSTSTIRSSPIASTVQPRSSSPTCSNSTSLPGRGGPAQCREHQDVGLADDDLSQCDQRETDRTS